MDACGSLLLTATIMQSLHTETESDWSLKNNNTSCNRIITIVTIVTGFNLLQCHCTVLHAGLLLYNVMQLN